MLKQRGFSDCSTKTQHQEHTPQSSYGVCGRLHGTPKGGSMEGLTPQPAGGLVLGNPTFDRYFKTERMRKCVEDYFLGEIENDNTRLAYGRAVRAFLTWCDQTGLPDLESIRPPHDKFIYMRQIKKIVFFKKIMFTFLS
jgi:hypothetical protein